MSFTILHTEWSDGWGGQERRIHAEMLGMQRRGHKVMLAARPSCILARQAAADGIPVEYVDFAGKFHLPSILRLKAIIAREGVQVVNTHSGIDSWVGAFAARLAGVKLVRTRHLNLPLHRRWYNFVHFMAHRIVTCGEAMRRNLIEAHGFPPAQLASIPTGIDFSRFAPTKARAAMRAELGVAPSCFVVLMVAVIRGVKRHEVAIRAFAELLQQQPDALLLLAGEGPMQVDMERLSAELGIAAQVRFLGQRSDIPDLLQAADAVLLTSRSEGVPQAITQALGLGKPVVATAVGGVPELVLDGETGLLVPSERPDLTAQALLRLVREPDLAARLSQGAEAHARQHYSLEAMLEATERVYAEILNPPC